jgi:hypothetical protein
MQENLAWGSEVETSRNWQLMENIYGIITIVLCSAPHMLGPGVYSASNRNEYQKYKNNNVSGE